MMTPWQSYPNIAPISVPWSLVDAQSLTRPFVLSGKYAATYCVSDLSADTGQPLLIIAINGLLVASAGQWLNLMSVTAGNSQTGKIPWNYHELTNYIVNAYPVLFKIQVSRVSFQRLQGAQAA